ncbi:MAG TPA: ABC transporter ATP-binding protein [Thermoanaerobaculia bacterium]|jgi:ABC-2 type transport system ATP-binding protein
MNHTQTNPPKPVIEAIDLSKRYGDGSLALDALNLAVRPGEIYCLLGARDAGKTSALHLFLGLTSPTAGRARVGGVDVAADPREARRRLAYVMENVAFYDTLTAMENLEFFAQLGGRWRVDAGELAMAMRSVGLPERAFRLRVRHFTDGMRQKLGFAAALVKEAPAWLLDDPLAGLDPQATAELVDLLREVRQSGKAILLATQDLFQARELADVVGILKEGRMVLTTTRADLRYTDLEATYLDYMRGGFSSLVEAMA